MIPYYNRLKNSQYFKNLSILASGTAIAQLIPILVSPLLVRLYTPEAFGLMAIYMAIVGSVATSVTGRYDNAIVLPDKDQNAFHLLGIAIYLSLVLSALILLVIHWGHDEIQRFIEINKLGGLMYLIPVSIMLFGFNISGAYIHNRAKSYSHIAYAKLIKAVSFSVIGILLGWVSGAFWGLIIGEVVGLMLGTMYMLKDLIHTNFRNVFMLTRQKYVLLKQYKDFPIYSGTTAVLDGFIESIPIFFISYYHGESVVGFYAIFVRVFSAPLSFLATAISQINAKKVVEIIQAKQDLLKYLYSLTGILLVIASIPALLLIGFGPFLFGFVLGNQWIEAGEYAQILVIAFVFRFAVSTVSSTLNSTNNPRYAMYWKIPAFLITLMVYLVFTKMVDIKTLLYIITGKDVILYFFYFYVIRMSAARPKL